MFDILLCKVTEKDKDVFYNLNQLFAYDFSELNKMDVSENGLYQQLRDIDDYYTKPDYTSFFIKVDGKLSGLAVVRFINEEGVNYLRHFFIMRKFRRQRVGEHAANIIFDMYPGKWRVSQFDFNDTAKSFWRNVIERYTDSEFMETRRADDKGVQQEFYSKNCKVN